MSIKALRDRWADPDLADRGRAVLLGADDGAGLPAHAGRVDLRGVPAPSAATGESWRPPSVEAGTWAGLDLSHARFADLRLTDVTVRDCVLDSADLTGASVRGGSWVGSGFVGAKLGGAQLAAGLRVEDCDLSKADLRKAAWDDVALSGVTFSGAKMQKVRFTGARLEAVGFAGADLREAEFGFNDPAAAGVSVRLQQVDLAGAKLAWAMFHATVVDRVAFPTGTLLVPHFPAAVRAALEATPGETQDHQQVDDQLGIVLRQGWAEETTGVLLDPSPQRGHETPDGLALRVLRAAGVEIVEA